MNNDLEILLECLKFTEDSFGLKYLENPEYETIGKKKNLTDIIEAKTPKIISLFRKAKKDFNNNSRISLASIEFVQLISTLKHGDIEQYFFDEILSKLKSSEPKDYYGIKCELSVYQHYKTSGIEIKKIPEETTTTPDFKIITDDKLIYIECKSILSESIKHTPRLDSFLQKLLNKINNNIVINIVLDSKDANKYEPEVEKLFDLAIHNKEEKIYTGKYAKLQLIKPSTNNNSDFVIPNFNPSYSIGTLKAEIINGKLVGSGGVNFLPFFPNDYKAPLAKHLRKGNSQIEKLGKGILHIQFPPMEVKELIQFIYEHGHRIQYYIIKHSLLSVVINIPYLMEKNGKANQIIPNINIPYFKPSIELQKIASLKPFWLNNYKVIELIEKENVIKCEFSIDTTLNSCILHIRSSNFGVNIKILIINNHLLHECIIEEFCSVKLGTIPKDIIKENNKLAIRIGEVETIYINGKKILL